MPHGRAVRPINCDSMRCGPDGASRTTALLTLPPLASALCLYLRARAGRAPHVQPSYTSRRHLHSARAQRLVYTFSISRPRPGFLRAGPRIGSGVRESTDSGHIVSYLGDIVFFMFSICYKILIKKWNLYNFFTIRTRISCAFFFFFYGRNTVTYDQSVIGFVCGVFLLPIKNTKRTQQNVTKKMRMARELGDALFTSFPQRRSWETDPSGKCSIQISLNAQSRCIANV